MVRERSAKHGLSCRASRQNFCEKCEEPEFREHLVYPVRYFYFTFHSRSPRATRQLTQTRSLLLSVVHGTTPSTAPPCLSQVTNWQSCRPGSREVPHLPPISSRNKREAGSRFLVPEGPAPSHIELTEPLAKSCCDLASNTLTTPLSQAEKHNMPGEQQPSRRDGDRLRPRWKSTPHTSLCRV